MEILRAEHLGMCFGVRDAIELALHESRAEPLTILGELVHNRTVNQQLQNHGVRIRHTPDEVQTQKVMITAHGTSTKTLDDLRKRGHQVLEATCPLVHHAHRALERLVRDGFHPIIIGLRNHVEVRGMTDDLESFDILLTEEDLEHIRERPRFGVVAQTTQPVARVRELVGLLRRRFPGSEIRFSDTVCRPTKERQQAALDLAARSDAVIVIGGVNSNNTRELARTCRQACPRVYRIQTARDLQPDWLEGVETMGVTAGTSTPDHLIDEVEAALRTMDRSTHEHFVPIAK